MTTPEITPTEALAALDAILNIPTVGPDGTIEALGQVRDAVETWAREQAEEKRIDELAQLFHRHRNKAHGWTPNWSEVDPTTRGSYRAGIRAVLAKLDEEREPKYNKGGWPTYPAVTRDAVYGRPVPTNTYGDPGADPAEEWDINGVTQRAWSRIQDAPANMRVRDRQGTHWEYRTGGWHWRDRNGMWRSRRPADSDEALAPYVEIVGGDQ